MVISHMDLSGKVAIITGASSGIGEATAFRLAEEGVGVVLAARGLDRLEKIAREIDRRGGRAIAVKTDVTQRAEVNALIQCALDRFSRVDIMVNNAAVMPLSLVKAAQVEEFGKTIDTNLKGVLYGISAVLPLFREQQRGHIVNVASMGARLMPSESVYCASKFAVRALSEGLRMELSPKDKIRVTVIEPGAVKTEVVSYFSGEENADHSWEFLESEDIANAIHYAVSQPERVNVDEIIVMPREQIH